MPGAINTRHSDTRLPEARSRRPLPDPRLFEREISTPPGQWETSFRASLAEFVRKAGDTMTGALNIHGTVTTDAQLKVRGAVGQTADVVRVQNSGGTNLVIINPNGVVGWGLAASQSTLGASGEANIGGLVSIAGLNYNLALIATGALSGGADFSLAMIGDSGSGTPAYQVIRNYRNIGDAIGNVWNMELGGAAGNLAIKNSVAGTIPIELTANAAQAGDMFKTKSSAGTAWFRVQSNGRAILQNGVGIDEFSSDGTFGGNSDLAVPTEKAAKTYVDTLVAAQIATAILKAIVDAKGDLIVATAADTVARMPAGTNKYPLVVNSLDATFGVSWKQLDEDGIVLADVTTLNASTTKHGLCPKLDGSATKFLNGTGAWSAVTSVANGSNVGDILVWDGAAWAIFPVGSDGKVLTADSSQALGLNWS